MDSDNDGLQDNAIILDETETIKYEVFLDGRTAELEDNYGTVYTPDGPCPATKEEQEAIAWRRSDRMAYPPLKQLQTDLRNNTRRESSSHGAYCNALIKCACNFC